MKILNKTFIIPILFNLIVVSFCYIDFLLPNKNIEIEVFSSFYNVVNNYPKGKKEILNILECKSGKTYRLINFPTSTENLLSGQKIEIKKTFLLGKLKSLKFIEINKSFNISLLYNNYIIIGSIISVVLSLLNVFFEINFLEIALAFSTVFVFSISAVYLFYF